jgi:hypothetical protein
MSIVHAEPSRRQRLVFESSTSGRPTTAPRDPTHHLDAATLRMSHRWITSNASLKHARRMPLANRVATAPLRGRRARDHDSVRGQNAATNAATERAAQVFLKKLEQRVELADAMAAKQQRDGASHVPRTPRASGFSTSAVSPLSPRAPRGAAREASGPPPGEHRCCGPRQGSPLFEGAQIMRPGRRSRCVGLPAPPCARWLRRRPRAPCLRRRWWTPRHRAPDLSSWG